MNSILALDPSASRHMGVAFCADDGFTYADEIIFNAELPLHDYLGTVGDAVTQLIEVYAPQTLVVEDTSTFRANKTTRLLSLTIGSILSVAGQYHRQVVLTSPKQWKKKLCGNGKATKKQVQKYVAKWLQDHTTNATYATYVNIDGTTINALDTVQQSEHAADAMGICVAYKEQQ